MCGVVGVMCVVGGVRNIEVDIGGCRIFIGFFFVLDKVGEMVGCLVV